jgi:hypothetical protein
VQEITSMKARVHSALGLAMLLVSVGAAQAQQADPALSPEPQPAGWSFTPRLTTTMAWDDNVLLQGRGSDLAGDLNTALDPGANLGFIGKKGSFAANYSGSLQMYRDFGAINNYGQTLAVSGRRRLSERTLLFAQQTYSKMPTTELPALVGIRFLRLGARLFDFRGGVESTLSKRLSLAASYSLQSIDFNPHPVLGDSFLGGTANGGSGTVRYQLTARATLTGDYSLQRARIATGSRFLVQNSSAGLEYRLAESTRVYAAFGIASMRAADLGTGKTAPAWKGGFTHRFGRAAFDASYGRAFLPSYGGGGTLATEELSSFLRVPLGRRLYTDASVSWRRNEPLIAGDQALTSVWISGTVGYALQPWARIEGFYGATHQRISRPGGQLDRNRIGVQIVTSKPMRIR